MNSALLHSTLQSVRDDDAGAIEKAIAEGVDLGPVWLGRHTLLMTAAGGGYINALRALLPSSNAKIADDKGRTALMMAAKRGCPDCVGMLLAASDPQAQDKEGKDALFYALRSDMSRGYKAKRACLQMLAERIDASRPQGAHESPRSVLWLAASKHQSSPETFEIFGPQWPQSEEAAQAIAQWGPQQLPLTHAALERALLAQAMGEAASAQETAPQAKSAAKAESRRL